MKKKQRKLSLSRETVRALDSLPLGKVVGGITAATCDEAGTCGTFGTCNYSCGGTCDETCNGTCCNCTCTCCGCC
ncbi:MAG: class I lanthipeptide [Acidobacteria bacterium]|nr:class I lanthipeptide [Acidobacteriota bacterium]